MSYILSKSDFNFDSAKKLFKMTYYASSVHCSYYSCLQLMIHILSGFTGTDADALYSQFQQSQKNKTNNKQGGYHSYLINEMNKSFVDKYDRRAFNTRITTLKQLRVEADYKEKQIDYSIGNSALTYSTEITKLLKSKFRI